MTVSSPVSGQTAGSRMASPVVGLQIARPAAEECEVVDPVNQGRPSQLLKLVGQGEYSRLNWDVLVRLEQYSAGQVLAHTYHMIDREMDLLIIYGHIHPF